MDTHSRAYLRGIVLYYALKMQEHPLSAYIAFDRYPSAKGSATHMTALLVRLSALLGPTLLLTLPGHSAGNGTIASSEIPQSAAPSLLPEGLHQQIFSIPEPNFLRRSQLFSNFVYDALAQQDRLKLIHFRDIWGGIPAIEFRHARLLFEVNSLPSIELPYRYPQISASAKAKIREMEKRCLKRCDAITVPSATIKDFLVRNGVSPSKITVITNGAHIPPPLPRKPGLPERYLVYFGALQTWQGINTLMKSFHYLQDLEDLHLVICSSQREKLVRQWHRMAERWELSQKITWLYELDKDELNSVVQGAVASMAPLADCDRNVEQGCSPLKIFESMACGVPVIASDLEVVREIMEDGKEGVLVPADRPAYLARAIRQLWEDSSKCSEMGEAGRETVKKHFLWEEKMQQYHDLLNQIIMHPQP